MFKYILRLLTTSTSLVALLVAVNPAIAATPANQSFEQFAPASVSLNLVSPSLQLNNDDNILLQHLGCSCAVCTQIEQSHEI